MGKKNKPTSSLGRSLIKDRFGGSKSRKFVADNSMLHTTEIQDGYDWGRLNLQSVTEESSFQEFLSTAELAGTEFQAEKLNIKFINPKCNIGLLTDEEKSKAKVAHETYKNSIKIPRRPQWTTDMAPDELQQNEKEQFLLWRRSLAQLQEEQGVLLTPFEKNLEFWRQLWRVVERSDVVVQIVDGRNPLLFRCDDLEKYVKEVSQDKLNLILINKADFLTEEQRQHWADYFRSLDVHVAFFSAVLAAAEDENADEDDFLKTENLDAAKEEDSADSESDYETLNESEGSNTETNLNTLKSSIHTLEKAVESSEQALNRITNKIEEIFSSERESSKGLNNSNKILTREGLVNLFRTIHTGSKVTNNLTTIGLVGYPNVGKSSTINALLSAKKVSVSATPGKTKHFQTLYLDKDILLCDCPGLVMPSFVYTKAEMIINGILPIDQMRDHVPPVNLVCSLIPRHVLEDKYGIMLPKPMEGEDSDRPPTAEELLNAYGYNRGFMTANGQPDNPRAARYVLKDFVNGKLLYALAPTDIPQEEYHIWPERKKIINANRTAPPRETRAIKPNRTTSEDIDKTFFHTHSQGMHVKGKASLISSGSHEVQGDKSWKKINKHENKKKREKLRRTYAHLDQH